MYVVADTMDIGGKRWYLPEFATEDFEQAKRLCSPIERTLRAWRPVVIRWDGDEKPPVANGETHSYPRLGEHELDGEVVYP